MTSTPKFFRYNAIWILGVVFFLIPFALRGAKMSFRSMKNDVTDWLPASFKETMELEWFGRHFFNERFVVVTWEGCSTDDERYHLLTSKIRAEILPRDGELAAPQDQNSADPVEAEQLNGVKNRLLGDRLGLFYDGDPRQDWGNRKERWLSGDDETWYFVTPDGVLYRWDNGNNVVASGKRAFNSRRGTYKVEGTFEANLGGLTKNGVSRFYNDPRLLTARRFSGITTGPEVLETLAAEQGPLWPRGDLAIEDKRRIARAKALERLTGTLFGPAWHEGYDWNSRELTKFLPKKTIDALPTDWQTSTELFIDRLADEKYDGHVEKIAEAPFVDRNVAWDELFVHLGIDSPAPRTAMLVYLSEAGKRDLAKVVGRPLMGKPMGRLLALAEESGISTDDEGELRLGGPPVDNVAIDEEGTITLVRLVGYSVALGLTLSMICFRSINVTLMVFLVGGVSAVTSLSIVYWTGWSVDAILMSMPSLVYVLGLSGAVHIVNYYRDACREHGIEGAPDRALAHGWGPCTLAALTTALGLLSLYTSNIMPIKKFGLFSAIGVVATLALLFTYLPAALEIWPPGYHRQRRDSNQDTLFRQIEGFWLRVADWVVKRYTVVIVVSLVVMALCSYGITKTESSVQLLKLFDEDSKIIRDYEWLEANLGELVPMEVIVRISPDVVMPSSKVLTEREKSDPEDIFRLSLLERLELTGRIQRAIERHFGDEGQKTLGRERVLGRGLSAATFAPEPPPLGTSAGFGRTALERLGTNRLMEDHYSELVDEGYVRSDTEKGYVGSELWRISLRLGALNDVDYGVFVHDLRDVVEPIVSAYRYRDEILRGIDRHRRKHELGDGYIRARIAILGSSDPLASVGEAKPSAPSGEGEGEGSKVNSIQQSELFSRTLAELLVLAGFDNDWRADWVGDPLSKEDLTGGLDEVFECVVLLNNANKYDMDVLGKHAKVFIDARDHVYSYTDADSKTAAERDDKIQVVYTGVVPVVYKAQRTLLESLVHSIGWAFLMIAAVMMVLLRGSPGSLFGLLNVRGGLISMIPNIFPVVLIFGLMGYMGILVDIGSMMTASVAMGVAVDDTIHFLSWYRSGLKSGMERNQAIRLAYSRVGTAMTYTTMIGGMGLAVFMLSTFTPTQRFGTLMLTLLAAALVGDLLLLPAILASPFGRYLSPPPDRDAAGNSPAPQSHEPLGISDPAETDSDAGEANTEGSPRSGETSSSGPAGDVASGTSHSSAGETPHSRKSSRRVDPPHRRRR